MSKSDIIKNSSAAAETANFYDSFWNPSSKIGAFKKARIKFIQESLASFSKAKLRILDLGCGTGWMAPYLSQFGDVVGVDFAPNTIEGARQTYGDYAEFILADSNSASLGIASERKFDLVVSSEVIEHVLDHRAFLDQIAEFLTADGLMILTTPNARHWHSYSQWQDAQAWIQPVENWLRPDELKKLLLENNFNILRTRGFGMVPPKSDKLSQVLTSERVTRILRRFRLEDLHGSLIGSLALHQFIFARKHS